MEKLMRNLLVLAAVGMLAGPAWAESLNINGWASHLPPKYRGGSTIITSSLSSSISFSTSKGPITIDGKDGHVTLPKDLSMDEASRAFWTALKDAHMQVCGKPTP